MTGNIHCDSISTGTPGEVKARMTTDGSIHASGNVGIGAEPNPQHRLTVVRAPTRDGSRSSARGHKRSHPRPEDWAGGIHTWDVYAEGAIGCGKEGEANCHLDKNGNIYAKSSVRTDGKVYAKGGLCFYWIDGWRVSTTVRVSSVMKGNGLAGTIGVAAPSDIRLKTDMRPIPYALDKVLNCRAHSSAGVRRGSITSRDIANRVSAGPDATPEENQQLWDKERTRTHEALSGEKGIDRSGSGNCPARIGP